jgi:hypothetical protein
MNLYIKNLIEKELAKQSAAKFDKPKVVSDLKELLIRYLNEQNMASEGEISDFMLKEVERAAESIAHGAQLDNLAKDMLKIT